MRRRTRDEQSYLEYLAGIVAPASAHGPSVGNRRVTGRPRYCACQRTARPIEVISGVILIAVALWDVRENWDGILFTPGL